MIYDQDLTWRIFHIFGHLCMWEEFVCLYIIVLDCDLEPNIIDVEQEIENIKGFIKQFSIGLNTEITNISYWIGIIDRYWDSRTQFNETELAAVKAIVNKRLDTDYFHDTNKSDEDIEKIVYEGTMAKQEAETKLENHNYLNDLNERINNLQKDNDELTSKLKVAQIQLEDNEYKIGILETEINLLQEQRNFNNVRIGDVTDVEWRDDDENNSTQLVKDIKKLNRALNKITEVKRNVKEIKKETVTELFSSLGCNTTIKDKQMKLVLVAALQQKLIRCIIDNAKYYFEHANTGISQVQNISVDNLEAAILFKTEDLIKLTTRFEDTYSVTEPIPVAKFYKGGEDIDPFFMEGMWEGHHEDYEVEICSFPAIFVNSDRRVYTKAQVIARPNPEYKNMLDR
ncbi:14977_t:CDS:2 [Rhizophagus irregularis]|nr:14977_t:CDS:2 [Rhizophagus irregularis]